LTPFQARTILGNGALLGRSVHGPAAAAEGLPHLDYLFFGHVFATPTKPLPPAGPEGLASVVAAAGGLPVLAIGGVAPANVRQLIEAGAHGVAAISGIWGTSDAAANASRYLAALEASGAAPSRSLAGRPDVRGA
jgi:thiamine-phosphate diphosphorylase